ncbi:unnamed protein product [Linum trigynum]|uniref:F-box protein At3g26010-like beta-propeller domain-containing protein n=1 Tax=Linum trigynum TaxID=586398 RepID=A0AAV2DTM6_9ROSI
MATESCTTVSDLALGARFRPARVCGKRRLLSEVNPPTPAISKLGDDLLTEILVRGFPNPRSACRSRAVCKQWRSLISDPCFGRRFLSYHQSMNTHPQLLHSTDKESALLSFIPWPADCASDIEYELTRFAVFDCFKDLLLCGFWEPGNRPTNDELARSYLLCNPFTKQWIALPLAPERPVGHTGLCARLVCEPLDSNSLFGLGDGSEYRFRVVCIYQDVNSMKLDVFSSESGEWTKEALVLQGYCRRERSCVVSCDGVLYLSYARAQGNHDGLSEPLIAAINPFRLDIPPTHIDVSPVSANNPWWDISISQGALHLIVFEEGTRPASARIVLSVWRLNEDCKFWRKVCEGPVKSSSEGEGN